ncbi:ABC-2 family transporter protein [Sutcliffiella horikoshii]|uniref:ABC transporter permease n=1 Tax=Sutcliffiella horikoshii TaxID=79883 RepID=UPI001CBF0823|nr:ABC-2 family transporter protein [Sutcliffiella horikoshii]UAL45688.1 ABC-2 family transporter protein [Sutcliffiella horikoshii]
MRKYLELLKSQIKVETAYLAWYWADVVSTLLRLVIMYFFWVAVFQNRTEISSISFESMITYVVIAMMLENYVSGAGNEMARNIKNGDIALELLKPYDYLTKLIFMDLGSKANSFVRTTIPIFLVAIIFIGIQAPPSLEVAILFLASMLVGILIGTQIDLIIGVLAFWTVNVWGVRVLREAIVKFFSGALIPLTLFPGWFQEVSSYLPFQSMIFVPVAIYTGQIKMGPDALIAFATQLFWLALLFIVVRVVWTQAVKKVTVFGG